jgi:pimeloyl-ACP methyl ester carboxylesterase
MAPSMATLPDGRKLAYEEFGDPSGAPVINCHGGLTSRLDVLRCADVARRAGIRLVSPDRPGIGRSDPKPGRTLLDWPNDVAALADLLGFTRFGLLGWSAGGPFAAACAFALGDRITSAALVASAVPGDWPNMAQEINRTDRALLRLSFHARPAAVLALHAMGLGAARAPATFRKVSCRSLDEPSRRVVMADPLSSYSDPIAEGLRRPRSVIDDYRIFGSAWGFSLEALTPPVIVWQGEADGLVPANWGRRLADAIPGARLRLLPEEGHFLRAERYAEIFSSLGASESSRP